MACCVQMRVRFAPSPTGALHIGGARTALYNWLLARGSGGRFLLRIEDTDRERSTPENVEQIFDALRWLELDWDEEPVFQSERGERHAEVVQKLVDEGLAYRSTAGQDQIKAWHEQHGNRGFRGEDEGEGAVRLRVADEGAIVVRDVIRGESTFENSLQDDLVIARADGTPLYHLAVVVDDLDMGITHVVRGADHYSNTAKQLLILEAMGEEPPLYAHVPLLHGPDGKKLSKRHGAASVQELRERGYLPEAVRNYVALLGWGNEESQEFFTTEELQREFSLERVSKSPAVFDEQKLRHINGRYLRELGLDDLTARLEALTGREGLRDAAEISQEKISTLADFWPLSGFFFDGPADDPAGAREDPGHSRRRSSGSRRRATRSPRSRSRGPKKGWKRRCSACWRTTGAKPRQVYQPIRVALAGGTVSPGIFETLRLLGEGARSLARIDAVLNRMSTAADTA